MLAAFLFVLCATGVGVAVYFVMDGPRRKHLSALAKLEAREERLDDDEEALQAEQRELTALERQRESTRIAGQRELAARERKLLGEVEEALQAERRDLATRERKLAAEVAAHGSERSALQADRLEFDGRVVRYSDLEAENRLLKLHLRHAMIEAAKQTFEAGQLVARSDSSSRLADALGRRHLEETRDWIAKALTVGNYGASTQRLRKAIDRTSALGLTLPPGVAEDLFARLDADYARATRSAQAREIQAGVQAQIREENLREREVQEAIEVAAREKRLVEEALAVAIAQAHGEHAVEVDRLREQLAEAEAKSVRAMSEAQKTKKGNVYVISNIGSFGENVFKIGLTRRLTPQDRIDELGSASVPFPFDVHMMIPAEDAPALEHELHRALHRSQVNRANPRKEFFRVTHDEICAAAKAQNVDMDRVEYLAVPEATQYRQSLTMTDADQDRADDQVAQLDDEPEDPDEPD